MEQARQVRGLARPTRTRFFVLAWLCGLAALAYVHRNCLSVPTKHIMSDLSLNEDEFAQITSIFFLGYAVFQIPSGWLGDRWGSRAMLTIIVITWSAAVGWLALAGGFLGLWLGRFVGGIAQAGVFPCSVNTISKWFPESGRSFPSGLLGSFMSIGGVVSATLMGLLLYVMTWQLAIVVLAIPGFACALGFYIFFRNRPDEHKAVNQAEIDLIQGNSAQGATDPSQSGLVILVSMLGSIRMWLICGQQFFRAAAYIFFATWYPYFLQETRGVDISGSGYLTSLTLVGVILGSASSGLIMDLIYRATQSRIWSRKMLAVCSLTACGMLVCLAYGVAHPWITTLVLALGSFCAGMSGPAGYTITIDLGGRHVGTVFSTMNMVGNIGAVIMPILVVKLAAWQSWNEAILLVAAMYFAAAACWACLNVHGSIFAADS